MRNETRLVFNALSQRIATLNGVGAANVKFSVTPSVQQTLENKLQLSSAFLKQINVIGVVEQTGEKLKLGTTGTIAGRTNTTTTDRVPADPTDLAGDGYACKQTNFDTAIKYAKLDAWAKFPDFQTRYRDVCISQQALDRMMIGFNGTSAAAATNRTTYPLLQDVNIGWLQHIRTDAPAHWMTDLVTVQSATIVEYAIVATIYTYAGPDSAVVLAASRSRLDAYVAESHRLGRDVTKSGLYSVLHSPGVQRVELTAPLADVVVDRTQAAYCTGITITSGGVDE